MGARVFSIYKTEAYGEVPPWLGYVFVLHEDEETEATNRPTTALFPSDDAFRGMSYNERYQEMLRRFMGDNIYQGGWFITTKVDDEGQVNYAEPLATATGKAFRAAVEGRVAYIRSLLDWRPLAAASDSIAPDLAAWFLDEGG
ncbi:PaeR7I family type II restriction endonuclease [Curtobacterium sp. 22159]|uniref:PaeR7I family type II restriction endonuclease n=1 Tax=Curtobacterium sp. 22159 TaxID=3453882 RepID=UPI003F8692F3